MTTYIKWTSFREDTKRPKVTTKEGDTLNGPTSSQGNEIIAKNLSQRNLQGWMALLPNPVKYFRNKLYQLYIKCLQQWKRRKALQLIL